MKTQDRINSLERQLATVAAKVDALINESNQQRQDIREMRQKHKADMREMNQRFYEKFDEMYKKMDSKFDKLAAQIQNLTIAALVGIGAIVLGGAIVWSAITTLK